MYRYTPTVTKFILAALLVTFVLPTSLFNHQITAQQDQIITVAVPLSSFEVVDFEGLLAEFETIHPGVQIVPEFINFLGDGSPAQDIISNYANHYDVFPVKGRLITPEITHAGYLLDLGSLVNGDMNFDPATYHAPLWQSFQWDGGIWALPVTTYLAMVYYDPSALNAAGVPFPDGTWTLQQYIEAARALTTYNSDGSVAIAGFNTGIDWGILPEIWFLRALYGDNFADDTTLPAQPVLNSPAFTELIEQYTAAFNEGVFAFNFTDVAASPIRLGYGPPNGPPLSDEDRPVEEAVPLPGGVIGTDPLGLAISSGTAYPELAYELVKFLSLRGEWTPSLNYGNVAAAVQPTQPDYRIIEPPFTIPLATDAQTQLNAGMPDVLPFAEVRFYTFLTDALTAIHPLTFDPALNAEPVADPTAPADALEAAQLAAQTAIDEAVALRQTLTIVVEPPANIFDTVSGDIDLQVGVVPLSGWSTLGNLSEMPNQEAWDDFNAIFAEQDPEVGQVSFNVTGGFFDENANDASCYIRPNILTFNPETIGAMLNLRLLNLEPLMAADPTFNPNDILPGILDDLRTAKGLLGIPIVIQPATLVYNPATFDSLGIPHPTEVWQIDSFLDTLQALRSAGYEPPMQPYDPGGRIYLPLIAAFGGLPLDFSTEPPTLDFTSETSVQAIRQVLDLAKDGMIEYSELAPDTPPTVIIPQEAPALADFEMMRVWNAETDQVRRVAYPVGTHSTPFSYWVIAGFVSADAEYPEACYRWLSTIAQHPYLLEGIPTNRAAAHNPAIQDLLPAGTLDILDGVDQILSSPNTVIFPPGSEYRQEIFWLKEAFDAYVLEDADLDTALADAERSTLDFIGCVDAIPDDAPDASQQWERCIQQVDPE